MHECATRIAGKPRRAVGTSAQTYMHIIYAHKNTYWKRREDIHPEAAAYMPTTTHKFGASDICGCAHSLFADSCWYTNTHTHHKSDRGMYINCFGGIRQNLRVFGFAVEQSVHVNGWINARFGARITTYIRIRTTGGQKLGNKTNATSADASVNCKAG